MESQIGAERKPSFLSGDIDLACLVGSTETFFSEHRNRKTLARRALSLAQRDELLSLQSLDLILAQKNLRDPYVRLSLGETALHQSRYMRPLTVQGTDLGGVLDVGKVAAELAEGATVSLHSIEHHHAPIKQLCDRLHTDLRAPAEAAVLLTPPGCQGIPVQHEAEVFLLQIHGVQRWTVHERARPSVPATRDLLPEETSESVTELTLQPGDCLYIPRGFPRSARSEGSFSCHLSVVIHSPSWGSIMTKLVDEVLNVSLFEAVPMAVDPDVSALVRATGERIEAARDAFLAHDLHDFMVRRGEARASQPVARAGFLRQADERLRLSGDSIVSRNTLVSFSVESLADKYVLLRVDGRTYRFPAVAEEAFRVVRTLMCQRVSELKLGLDYEATLMLVGHLVDNGVLVIH